ncbi:MAG: hypothetical protein KF729_32725 [Sandaracinaceae bacterium]|nr:hypothetical protein [Sandaracinaceae bacterium]
MAFRQQRAALLARADLLRREVSRAREERDLAQQALDRAERALDAQARAAIGSGAYALWILGALVATGALVGSFYFDPPPDEQHYGVVRSARGAPLTAGDRCTLTWSSICGDYDANLVIVCAGHAIYGGPSRGCLDCADEARTRCTDPTDDWASGGDPILRFDRALGEVVIEGGGGRLEVVLDLHPPPSAAGARAP